MSRMFPNLMLEEYQEKCFYHALRTKGFVILAGLSGTGKTKIFEEFKINNKRELSGALIKSIKEFNEEYQIEGLTLAKWHDHSNQESIVNLIANPNAQIEERFQALYAFCKCWNGTTQNSKGIPPTILLERFSIIFDYSVTTKYDASKITTIKRANLSNKYACNKFILSGSSQYTSTDLENAFGQLKNDLSWIRSNATNCPQCIKLLKSNYILNEQDIKLFAFIFNPYAYKQIFSEADIYNTKDVLFEKENGQPEAATIENHHIFGSSGL